MALEGMSQGRERFPGPQRLVHIGWCVSYFEGSLFAPPIPSFKPDHEVSILPGSRVTVPSQGGTAFATHLEPSPPSCPRGGFPGSVTPPQLWGRRGESSDEHNPVEAKR